MVTNGPRKNTSGLRLKNEREAIANRPSLSVRASWESRYSSLGPPKLRTCFVHHARTTTPSRGCFVSAPTTWACHGPAASAEPRSPNRKREEIVKTSTTRSTLRIARSERPRTPEAIGIDLKPHFEGFENAGVGSTHFEDRFLAPNPDEREIGEDRIDGGEVRDERGEGLPISIARAYRDVA